MRKYLLPIFAIAMTGLIGSCTKSYSPTTGPYQNLQIALQTIAIAEKVDTVNAITGGTFYGNSGTRYVIPKNDFQTSSGAAVTTGNVTILTAEFLNKTDMMFSGIIPYSLLGNLATAGEIYILPTQNLSTLNFTSDIRYQAIMPQQNSLYELDSLSLFYGRQDPVSQTVSWLSNPSQPGSITKNGDSVTINGTATGFVSAGKFIDVNNTQYPTFTVTPSVTGAKITDTVAAFVVYDNYNSIWLMQNVNEATHVFTESKVRPIPFHLVVMTVINGYFYGGIVAVPQVSNGANYTVNMIQIAPSDFKTMVGNLP